MPLMLPNHVYLQNLVFANLINLTWFKLKALLTLKAKNNIIKCQTIHSSYFITMGNQLPCCQEKDEQNQTQKQTHLHPSRGKSIVAAKTQKPPPSNTPYNTRSYIQPNNEQKKIRGPQHYQCVKYLGKGSYGFVVLAQQKSTNMRFAMKIIPKTKINELNLLQTKLIPAIRKHPFLTNITQIFQNEENIYIVMQYLPKGDLYFYSRKQEFIFPESTIRDMLAQIIVAVEFLHKTGIVYRQLKPENILVNDDGHIKLTDYGLSKVLVETDLKKGITTFFGSIQYMAPEIMNGTFDQRADLWAMGVLMFQLKFKQILVENEGQTKFSIHDYKQMVEKKFIDEKINSKIGRMTFQFRDVLLSLLEKDPNERISLQKLKKHPFFEDVDWQAVQSRENTAPLADLLKKGDYIKFRDPTTEPKNRFDIFQRHSKANYFNLQLFQLRNSQ